VSDPAHVVKFEILDSYLLDGSVAKREVVQHLLAQRAKLPEKAAAFMQGLEMLGERVPDLALFALRLVLAGKSADDASVVLLRDAAQRARRTGNDSESRREYWAVLEP